MGWMGSLNAPCGPSLLYWTAAPCKRVTRSPCGGSRTETRPPFLSQHSTTLQSEQFHSTRLAFPQNNQLNLSEAKVSSIASAGKPACVVSCSRPSLSYLIRDKYDKAIYIMLYVSQGEVTLHKLNWTVKSTVPASRLKATRSRHKSASGCALEYTTGTTVSPQDLRRRS